VHALKAHALEARRRHLRRTRATSTCSDAACTCACTCTCTCACTSGACILWRMHLVQPMCMHLDIAGERGGRETRSSCKRAAPARKAGDACQDWPRRECVANAQGMEAHDGCAGWADEEASETCLAASSVSCPACLSRASMSWCQPSCAARSLVLCALRLLARRLLHLACWWKCCARERGRCVGVLFPGLGCPSAGGRQCGVVGTENAWLRLPSLTRAHTMTHGEHAVSTCVSVPCPPPRRLHYRLLTLCPAAY